MSMCDDDDDVVELWFPIVELRRAVTSCVALDRLCVLCVRDVFKNARRKLREKENSENLGGIVS